MLGGSARLVLGWGLGVFDVCVEGAHYEGASGKHDALKRINGMNSGLGGWLGSHVVVGQYQSSRCSRCAAE